MNADRIAKHLLDLPAESQATIGAILLQSAKDLMPEQRAGAAVADLLNEKLGRDKNDDSGENIRFRDDMRRKADADIGPQTHLSFNRSKGDDSQ